MDTAVDWSNLPVELWPLIGGKLKPRIEYLRFRSVCNSWRSYLPPFLPSSPPNFPLPFCSDGPSSFLSQTTVYLLRPPATSSPPGGRLVKVEESERMILRNPVTSRRIRGPINDTSCLNNDVPLPSPSSVPGCFNLVELDMVELQKSYFLRYIHGSGSVCGVRKVVVMSSEYGQCSILILSDKGKLGFARSGDQKLRWLGEEGCVFDDVVVYGGESYVVDRLGCVFRIGLSSYVLEKISFEVFDLHGGRKHLVGCCGELYVVDRYYDRERSKIEGRGVELDFMIFGRRGRYRRFRSDELKVAEFRVYRLEWGDGELGRWVQVKSLADQVLFLANDCSFAVSAQELVGAKGNCIYFTDENDVNLALRDVIRPQNYVFDLEDRSIQKLEGSAGVNCQIFWPPPT